jgi:hypothetical protein
VLNKPEDEPKGKGKAVDKGKGKATENGGKGKGKGKEVEVNGNGNGSAEPPKAKPYHQLQPEETPITSAQRAAFTERVSSLPPVTQLTSDRDHCVIYKRRAGRRRRGR